MLTFKKKSKEKEEKNRRMFIDFLRIGHWQKTRTVFLAPMRTAHKKKENDGEFRNCLVARTHTAPSSTFSSRKNHHHLTGVASKKR
jgi:hypothetical protein